MEAHTKNEGKLLETRRKTCMSNVFMKTKEVLPGRSTNVLKFCNVVTKKVVSGQSKWHNLFT